MFRLHGSDSYLKSIWSNATMSSVSFFLQVECELFPDINKLYLRTVKPDEVVVKDLLDKVENIFNKNCVGPTKWGFLWLCFVFKTKQQTTKVLLMPHVPL